MNRVKECLFCFSLSVLEDVLPRQPLLVSDATQFLCVKQKICFLDEVIYSYESDILISELGIHINLLLSQSLGLYKFSTLRARDFMTCQSPLVSSRQLAT